MCVMTAGHEYVVTGGHECVMADVSRVSFDGSVTGAF